MLAQRVERIWLKTHDSLGQYCHLAKNLYNEANYLVRQEFIQNGKWLRYLDYYPLLKNSESYQQLPVQTAQQLLRLVEKNWTSFFRAIKEWKKHPEKFLGRPKLPKYLQKDGQYLLLFTNQQLRFKNGIVIFPRKLGLEVKTRFPPDTVFSGARILPQGIGYVIEFIYKKTISEKKRFCNRLIGLDLGIDNLVTMVNNIGKQPIVIKGQRVKATNQWFNKRLASLKSIYTKTGVRNGKNQLVLQQKRKKQLQDWLHKVSRYVIDWCVEHDIDTLIVGRNKHWKQEVNLQRKTNQNFVTIPFYTLIQQFKYKCEEVGIHFIETDEIYTSKCSFLDYEPIQKHTSYLGRRIKRGLFQSAKGHLINADVNGAYNIIRKVSPSAFKQSLKAEGLVGVGLHPKSIQVVGYVNR